METYTHMVHMHSSSTPIETCMHMVHIHLFRHTQKKEKLDSDDKENQHDLWLRRTCAHKHIHKHILSHTKILGIQHCVHNEVRHKKLCHTWGVGRGVCAEGLGSTKKEGAAPA